MISGKVRGDVLAAPVRHVVFAVNTEGFNDAGFAGVVARRFWPALANTGPRKLGEVLTRDVEGRTFHAVVCHSLYGGWAGAADVVRDALDRIATAEQGEPVAVVAIGRGPIGQLSGAPADDIEAAIARSAAVATIYSL